MAQQIQNIADLKTFLAGKIAEQKAQMPPPTSTRIRATREGFELPTGKVVDELEGVIVDMRYVNTFYTKRYVPGQIESPDCWAVNADSNAMAPDDKSAKQQSESCTGCPHNEWGSGTGGRGKACQNKIRLAIITPDAVNNDPIYTIELSPIALTPFLKQLNKLAAPIQTVITKFFMDKKVDYPKVLTDFIAPAPDALAPIIMGMIAGAQEKLNRGFDYE